MEFKNRVIFMSMFNDIQWKTNDENCISNDENVKNCGMRSRKDIGHSWVQGRKRSGMELLLPLNKEAQIFSTSVRVFCSIVCWKGFSDIDFWFCSTSVFGFFFNIAGVMRCCEKLLEC